MQTITLPISDQTASEVHDYLSGQACELATLVDQSRRLQVDHKSVCWSVPINSHTVHCIVTLHLFATELGVALNLQAPVNLSTQEMIFHQDFLTRGLPHRESTGRQLKLFIDENWALLQDGIGILTHLGPLLQPTRPRSQQRFDSALLIGQYGGEHVGDAAILGGVLLRLNKEFGTTRAELLSHRPGHTERLVAGLETPVKVTVHTSSHRQVRRLLRQVEALVFAGGPIMDLPRVLAKQIAVAATARSLDMPIVIDRVGVGPFKRQASRFAARQLVKLASSLSVRTSTAATDPIVADLKPQILHDPAFDYLPTRSELTRLTELDKISVEALIANTENRLRIGINLRPIRHLWSPRGERYSAEMADQFLQRFASGLQQFAAQSATPPTFIFFCMNPQEFGMSDLRIAYQLHRQLDDKIDFRVWQGDPDVDGVIHLLRQLDAAICMRFHACIFALTQQLPTIGLDYYPGQGGKVEQLFKDMDRSDEACRMDQMETEWLLDTLHKLLPAISVRKQNRQ